MNQTTFWAFPTAIVGFIWFSKAGLSGPDSRLLAAVLAVHAAVAAPLSDPEAFLIQNLILISRRY